MKPKPTKPNIIQFVTDPQFLNLTPSPAQRTLLKAIYGLPLTKGELAIWKQCTDREKYPGKGFSEITVISGARSGKDAYIAAPIIAYQALFGDHGQQLGRGERAVFPLVAQNQKAAGIAFNYIKDYLTGSPLLRQRVVEVLVQEIHLDNRTSITCFPCTARATRGWSIPAGVLDEIAFFRWEGTEASDREIQQAVRRGMVAFERTKLLKISTAYLKDGILFEDFRTFFGQDDPDRLVWRSTSLIMNPTLTPERLEQERRIMDPEQFAREYEAVFSDNLMGFLPGRDVDAVTVKGRRELPPRPGCAYVMAADTAAGGQDTFTLTICHAEHGRVVQDVIRSWGGRGQHVNLDGAIEEIADLRKRYRAPCVWGDRFAGDWVRQAFARHGIPYVIARWTRSEAYLELAPQITQQSIEILDHHEQARELRLLEKRYHAGGRISVDHPSGGHDDFSNCLALAAALVAFTIAKKEIEERDDEDDPEEYDELAREEEDHVFRGATEVLWWIEQEIRARFCDQYGSGTGPQHGPARAERLFKDFRKKTDDGELIYVPTAGLGIGPRRKCSYAVALCRFYYTKYTMEARRERDPNSRGEHYFERWLFALPDALAEKVK